MRLKMVAAAISREIASTEELIAGHNSGTAPLMQRQIENAKRNLATYRRNEAYVSKRLAAAQVADAIRARRKAASDRQREARRQEIAQLQIDRIVRAAEAKALKETAAANRAKRHAEVAEIKRKREERAAQVASEKQLGEQARQKVKAQLAERRLARIQALSQAKVEREVRRELIAEERRRKTEEIERRKAEIALKSALREEDVRLLRLEQEARRARFAAGAEKKRRIVDLLSRAAADADPGQHLVSVREIREMWLSIGNVGSETMALGESYRAALKEYRSQVRAVKRRKQEQANLAVSSAVCSACVITDTVAGDVRA